MLARRRELRTTRGRQTPGAERRGSMNRLETLVTRLAASGTFLSAGAGVAQSQDPAVVNAEMEHVRFENSHVRAIEGVIPPGAKEQMHSHPAFVVYLIGNNFDDGKVVEVELTTGDVLYREPQT